VNGRCVAVAWSGGRDSTALLHATLRAAEPLKLRVVALHVHHGLSPHADAWANFCAEQCRRWQQRGHALELHVERLHDRPARGESVEAWARKARYRALHEMAQREQATLVLLAHHRRDQAETVLLQALRGAGVAGLAGMPRCVERDGITWARPWLAQDRAAIDAYVRRHRLRHVDDDSNADPRFARNRLRLAVWPALCEAFPQAEAAIADSAAWAHDAARCLEDLAAQDLAVLRRGDGLDIEALVALAPHRRGNALRHWLRGTLGQSAPASVLTRLSAEMSRAGTQRWPVPGGELRCHRGVLAFHPAQAEAPAGAARESRLQIRRAGRHPLPGWGGSLRVTRVREGGIPFAWLAHVELRSREGAEQFQAGLGRPPRSLKKQFQAAGIPAWQRDGPLLYSGGQLLYVPGLGIDARVIGLPGQPQARLEWLPDGAPERRG
jgi:tRNA(Ile)-lysidine synthase